MSDTTKTAILRTLIYADIFKYPLTLDELHRFLILNRFVSKTAIKTTCAKIPSVREENGFYMLKNSKISIAKRKRKEAVSKGKIVLARRLVHVFRIIPWVLFVGVSGAASAGNASETDDIDFFVITKINRLWLTRLFLVILLQTFGLRRKRSDKRVTNKICLNMFLSEQYLSFPKNRRDVYTAHEIVQMSPIFDRDDTYSRFLKANEWVKRCMANAIHRQTTQINTRNNAESFFILSALEFIARRLQLWYMRKHRTSETVTDTMLAFHPINYRAKILSLYTKKLNQYGIV